MWNYLLTSSTAVSSHPCFFRTLVWRNYQFFPILERESLPNCGGHGAKETVLVAQKIAQNRRPRNSPFFCLCFRVFSALSPFLEPRASDEHFGSAGTESSTLPGHPNTNNDIPTTRTNLRPDRMSWVAACLPWPNFHGVATIDAQFTC